MKPETLRGRTAIITGNVTAALSYALTRAGANVVVASMPTSVHRFVEQALGAYGRIDIAVNDGDPAEVSLAMKYEIPPMLRAGGGHIVNVVTPPTRAAVTDLVGTGIRLDIVDDTAKAVLLLTAGQFR